MGRREWRWWEEFEKNESGPGATPDGVRRTERRNALIIRVVVTVGRSILAAFKALGGAWLFALAYAICAVGFFIAFGIAARRRELRE